MQKVYYSKKGNKQIIDVSGKKPFEDIKKEFGDFDDYQVVDIDFDKQESYKIDDVTGKLSNETTEVEAISVAG
jgi:hypothetical protein